MTGRSSRRTGARGRGSGAVGEVVAVPGSSDDGGPAAVRTGRSGWYVRRRGGGGFGPGWQEARRPGGGTWPRRCRPCSAPVMGVTAGPSPAGTPAGTGRAVRPRRSRRSRCRARRAEALAAPSCSTTRCPAPGPGAPPRLAERRANGRRSRTEDRCRGRRQIRPRPVTAGQSATRAADRPPTWRVDGVVDVANRLTLRIDDSYPPQNPVPFRIQGERFPLPWPRAHLFHGGAPLGRPERPGPA